MLAGFQPQYNKKNKNPDSSQSYTGLISSSVKGKHSFTIPTLWKETSKRKTDSRRDNLFCLYQYGRQCFQHAVTRPKSLRIYFPGSSLSPSLPLDLSSRRTWICSGETLSRAKTTCDEVWSLPCFASVMPESPQTMISLVANYAAGITTLPRTTGLHYCRAATQNILWWQEMSATELFFWTVSLGSNSDQLYKVNQT